MDKDALTIALLVVQLLWGALMAFFFFTLRGIREDTKDNSRSVARVAEMLAREFLTKEEMVPVRKQVHDLANDVSVLQFSAGIPSRGHD